MATYTAPRGVVRDLRFFLKQYLGGPLTDQYNFTDGLAHGQWPTVRFYTGPNGTGTEITALVVRDISADTIASASHKDPTGSAGVWRQSQGVYWQRVEIDDSIPYGTIYMRPSFKPTAASTWAEDFEVEVTIPGDIDPNAIITVADVTRGWVTSLDSTVIEGLIADATDEVYGRLEERGISDPEALWVTLGGMPRLIRRAIINRTRCFLTGYDLSSGTRARSVQEGSEKVTFASVKEGSQGDPCTDWIAQVDLWLKKNAPGRQPMIGTVTRRVGHTINDDGLANEFDPRLG